MRSPVLVRTVLATLLAGVVPAASPREIPPSRPSVLLITVDTLRPDALGFVSGRNATPNLDALAREGCRFPSAVSPVPLTLPAHTSILTGLLPARHGVHDNGQVLGRDMPTLAERFAAGGYATGAFVAGYPLRAPFGLDRGFARYDDTLPTGSEGWLERKAPDVTEAALAWLRTAPRPFFLWVHYYDPHDPYTPPGAFFGPGLRGAYDGEVAYADHAIGALRAGVPERDRAGLVTVFTADHGESLGEHRERTHGFFLYDTTTVVPAIVHWPVHIGPRVSRAPVRLVDLAPTMLDLAGLAPLAAADGVSLAALLGGRKQPDEPAFLETQQPWITYGWSPLAAVRHGGFKYVRAPRPELYDLARDPGEETNVLASEPSRASSLQALLERFERLPRVRSAARSGDPSVMESLRALGYVGGAPAAGPAPAGLPDPKDKIAQRDALIDAESRLRGGDFAGALARFEAVLAVEPRNRFATLRSGIALLKKGDARSAATRLRAAVTLDPEQAESRYALADALTRAGDEAAAIPEWMETVRLQPRRAAAWSNLGTALGRVGRFTDAERAFAEALRITPDDPLLLANRAFAVRAAGRPQDALAHLRRSAERAPVGAFAFAGPLGLLILATHGSADEARSWLARARAGELDFALARFELARLEAARGDAAAARAALAEAVRADARLRARASALPALAPLLP